MDEQEWLAGRFEEHRPHLRAVAYRMLGSLPEAGDAVQDAWLRLSGSGADGVENLGGWLTTVVARVCLNMLHSRAARRDDPVGVHVPDPVISHETVAGPEDEALLSHSVGLALIVVLDTLAPAERLALMLHDIFDVPFEEIARMVGRSRPRRAATRNETRGALHALFTVWVDDGKGAGAAGRSQVSARAGCWRQPVH
jgi:RNA polymerase sigma factor (sigma-70 family)